MVYNVTVPVVICFVTTTGVQVSVEDAEVLLGTAERISVAGGLSNIPYKVIHIAHYIPGAHMYADAFCCAVQAGFCSAYGQIA